MKEQPQPRELFFKELREKTSGYHHKLEETALSQVILSEGITIGAYIDYLKVMYVFTQPFEETFFPLAKRFFPDIHGRERADFLKNDLLKLGVAPSELDEADFVSFEVRDIEEIAGAIYVMEGSSLGGRVIFKHVHKTLGLSEDTGASYFYGYGSETGKMWTSFLDALWDFTAQHSQQKVIEGAVKTFKEMYNLFNRQEKYAF